uniref:Uncharacterized protein n=1 Tax=Physcomitrium patens TaxID=3218 RepID=A0A2K1KXH0_PHYPA|nr:hypothetical protein PHYPA_005473 [Physcomitrium patens]
MCGTNALGSLIHNSAQQGLPFTFSGIPLLQQSWACQRRPFFQYPSSKAEAPTAAPRSVMPCARCTSCSRSVRSLGDGPADLSPCQFSTSGVTRAMCSGL